MLIYKLELDKLKSQESLSCVEQSLKILVLEESKNKEAIQESILFRNKINVELKESQKLIDKNKHDLKELVITFENRHIHIDGEVTKYKEI